MVFRTGNKWITTFLALAITISSCKKEPPQTQYLHIAHTYITLKPYFLTGVAEIDYNKYELLLLGGDMAYQTTIDSATIEYTNQIFDIANENTLWSIGNHDLVNQPELLPSYTNKPSYYTKKYNNISFAVLNTQDSQSDIIGNQLQMLKELTDTLSTSTHLIVMHHKLLWLAGHETLEAKIESISNGKLGDCNYCLQCNNFYQDVYPLLEQVQKRGIQVICVAGNIGNRVDKFEYQTEEGIYFLASGMNEKRKTNYGLVFDHQVEKGQLNWSFVKLKNL